MKRSVGFDRVRRNFKPKFVYNLPLEKRSVHEQEDSNPMAFEVRVDPKKCKGCEECLEVCTVNVFEMREGKSVPVRVKECLGCQSCVEICKESAIMLKELEPEMSEIARMLLKDIL